MYINGHFQPAQECYCVFLGSKERGIKYLKKYKYYKLCLKVINLLTCYQ